MTVINCNEKTATRLRRKRSGIEQISLLLRELNDLLAEERREYAALLAEVVGESADSIITGKRPCETSPVASCVYGDDMKEDVCLFCGQPSEFL
ncbi:hypothetical protein ACFW2V_12835 [Streptomyces sp. NPDC058947]|uniref:hypothetical protein n=1 Tax=Streptomyces sp. NPDC058947 TaxID=3346675 RepID=UPI00367B33E5